MFHARSILAAFVVVSGQISFASEISTVVDNLRWMIAAVVAFVACDFWFGRRESRSRYDKAKAVGNHYGIDKYRFHLSRAGRRTMNKLVDYVAYMVVAIMIGKGVFDAFDVGITYVHAAAAAVALAGVFEISSILGHVFYLHHIKPPKITGKSVLHFLARVVVAFVKRKSPDVGDAMEEGLEKTLEEEQRRDEVSLEQVDSARERIMQDKENGTL